jgi:hypothetical protein
LQGKEVRDLENISIPNWVDFVSYTKNLGFEDISQKGVKTYFQRKVVSACDD